MHGSVPSEDEDGRDLRECLQDYPTFHHGARQKETAHALANSSRPHGDLMKIVFAGQGFFLVHFSLFENAIPTFAP